MKPSGSEPFAYVPGEVLVKFRDDTQKRSVIEISCHLKLAAVRMIAGEHLYVMKIINGASVESVIERLKEYPDVEYSEPNYVVETQ